VKLLPHHELRYYWFALNAGVSNVLSNGMRLGTRKTIGKIAQPINAYSRFPEYYWFEEAIGKHLRSNPSRQKVRMLDVGSPKMMGLYLAYKTSAEMTLTDITELNLDEYQLMWTALQKKAKGTIRFALQDARSLGYGDEEFDVVYSMSVIEHIEGEEADSRAVRELVRVLKPGGLLVLSLPFGPRYVEQQTIGVAGAARKTGDQRPYFFQRIYDSRLFQERILNRASELKDINLITVQRSNQWLGRSFGTVGESVRGMLGCMNPLLSVAINRSHQGMNSRLAGNYGEFHSASDVYGDIILTGQKR
jgi:SAM-dependent methyltransferase